MVPFRRSNDDPFVFLSFSLFSILSFIPLFLFLFIFFFQCLDPPFLPFFFLSLLDVTYYPDVFFALTFFIFVMWTGVSPLVLKDIYHVLYSSNLHNAISRTNLGKSKSSASMDLRNTIVRASNRRMWQCMVLAFKL